MPSLSTFLTCLGGIVERLLVMDRGVCNVSRKGAQSVKVEQMGVDRELKRQSFGYLCIYLVRTIRIASYCTLLNHVDTGSGHIVFF